MYPHIYSLLDTCNKEMFDEILNAQGRIAVMCMHAVIFFIDIYIYIFFPFLMYYNYKQIGRMPRPSSSVAASSFISLQTDPEPASTY